MNSLRCRALLLAGPVLALATFLSTSHTACAQDISDADEAARMLRDMQFARDFEGGFFAGKEFLKQFPDHEPLKAWFVLNKVRYGMTNEAVTMAEAMTASNPNSGWAQLALACALTWSFERHDEALEASRRAIALLPDDPDVMFFHAEVLSNQGRHEEVFAFVEEKHAVVTNPAELLAIKAYTYGTYTSRKPDQSDSLLALMSQTYAEAQRADPMSVQAHYLHGLQLLSRPDEAYPLLARAATLAPASNAVHRMYWQAIRGLSDRTAEDKETEIRRGIESFISARPEAPGALQMAAGAYGQLGDLDRKEELEERILALHPESAAAAEVLMQRIRTTVSEAGEGLLENPALRRQIEDELWSFINRDRHHNTMLLGEAYWRLFGMYRDDESISDEKLLKVAEGMAINFRSNPHMAYAPAAIALANRGVYLEEAQHIVDQGYVFAREDMERRRPNFDSEGEFESALNFVLGPIHAAEAWVHFKAGRTQYAAKSFQEAVTLNPNDIRTLYYKGQYYESLGDLDRAEDLYIRGVMTVSRGTNPNVAALRELYVRKEGSDEGFDDYFARIDETSRSRRMESILGSRLEEPRPVGDFTLATLDGDTLSLADIRGKVAVIKFWGTWCGVCVVEMPAFQKLSDQYADDPDVLILTINNDRSLDMVRTFIKNNSYEFAILLDDGFVNSAGIRGFPTTWFLDQTAGIAFEKVGASHDLAEEFTWRIEALKPPSPVAPPDGGDNR